MVKAWITAQDLVAHAAALSHPKDEFAVLIFPDESDKHWESFLTQVPQDELQRGVPVQGLPHEPLVFLSGMVKGYQRRRAAVDKEGFAIVSTCKRLTYLVWGGVSLQYTPITAIWHTFSSLMRAVRRFPIPLPSGWSNG